MSVKIPHTHVDFLAEAIQDKDRKIQGKIIKNDFWIEVTIEFVAGADVLWEFRFTDTVPKIVSSLTDKELFAIADEHASRNEDVNYSVLRAVANAAAQRADKELITPKERASLYENKFLIY